MPVFSYMIVYCPICRGEFNGMMSYGRSNCCSRICHEEWEWRRTVSILGKEYKEQNVSNNRSQQDRNKGPRGTDS